MHRENKNDTHGLEVAGHEGVLQFQNYNKRECFLLQM